MTITPPNPADLTTESECATCSIPMRRTWTDDLIDYRWRAIDGSISGTAEGVPAGAPTSTPDLLELLAARGDIHTYSIVLVRYQNGFLELPWEHLHRAIEPATQIAPEQVPDCHGSPMRAAPGAWICRVDGEIVSGLPAEGGER